MPVAELATKIQRAVDAGFDEQVQFLAELVKFPSLRGAEQGAQDFVAKQLAARGYQLDRWQINLDDIRHLPGFSPVLGEYHDAVNVVGTKRPATQRGRSLILNGHIDVVPVGPLDMWHTPPFDPRVSDGWMNGRGAGDMKAGIAACIFAMQAIERAGLSLGADVHLQSVVEEECTGNGALACVARGYRAEAALIPEPFWNKLSRAQVGVIWFQIEVRGLPAHVLDTKSGANAIEAAYDIMRALHELEERWNAQRHQHQLFAHLEHPINFNVGKIAGGDWPSSVPAWCTFDLRVAIYPEQDPRQAVAEVEACVLQAARQHPFLKRFPPKIICHGHMARGYVLDGAHEATRTLEQAHQAAFGAELEHFTSTACSDARVLGLYADTPTLVYGPNADSIHGFDERVELESMRKVTQSIALFVADWCGCA